MSYLVLARKCRPKTFAELVGQDHVKRALINALDQNRVHHAFLFTGTRGVGKTTIARIFAKALNCEQGVTSEPCGLCSTCVDIDNGRFLDLIEVDAASRTGVDDTRELLENVQFAPTSGRYKVYLIDEVHMFSKSSFNALLKTLEEPPPHVKFLFATTDPKKVPVTVLSRCLQFHLRSLPIDQIAGHLANIVDQEDGVSAEPEAILLLAQGADGSMRDALSLLDQAIAYGAGDVTAERVNTMLGHIDQDFVLQLFDAVIAHNASEMLAVIEELAACAPDYNAVLDGVIQLIHSVALAQAVPLNEGEDPRFSQRIRTFAEQCSAEDIQLYYQIGILGRRDLNLAPSARGGLEMTMLRMMAFQPDFDSGGKPEPTVRQMSEPVASEPSRRAAPEVNRELAPKSAKVELKVVDTNDNWFGIVAKLGLAGMPKQLAENCILDSRQGDHFALCLSEQNQFLCTDSNQQKLNEALKSVFGPAMTMAISTQNHQRKTPAMLTKQRQDERQKQAETSIEQDPAVQKLQQMFDAKIEPGSIKPVD